MVIHRQRLGQDTDAVLPPIVPKGFRQAGVAEDVEAAAAAHQLAQVGVAMTAPGVDVAVIDAGLVQTVQKGGAGVDQNGVVPLLQRGAQFREGSNGGRVPGAHRQHRFQPQNRLAGIEHARLARRRPVIAAVEIEAPGGQFLDRPVVGQPVRGPYQPHAGCLPDQSLQDFIAHAGGLGIERAMAWNVQFLDGNGWARRRWVRACAGRGAQHYGQQEDNAMATPQPR
ncbi:hypothetical protein UCD39_12935 [Nitrospirillum sp. BR 11752]|uniref:hypothetical protein n=1 Tax=Nitrospirillum sp. BR 11752 TaxID=3104293 RepID=UPI002EB2D937|nr:hypothetical protein [Nitrospirillum sp. BR 11752]